VIERIDLADLKRSAESGDGDSAVVERSWLKQVYAELSECRADKPRCFGLKPGQSL
jgi:hypothetical protein